MKKQDEAQAHKQSTSFFSRILVIGYFTFFSYFPLIQSARSQIRLQDHKFIYKIANSLQDRKFVFKITNLQTKLQCISKIANAFERLQMLLLIP